MSLVSRLSMGLKEAGVEMVLEKIKTATPLYFPVSSIPRTVKMMITTFFRQRIPIRPISDRCMGEFDLIIVGGPTWSYNPSGPILSLLDRHGAQIFKGKEVVPLISCRGYWRMHWWGLRAKLVKCGAVISNYLVFSHPHPEPWRTIGVFLKIAGKKPEKAPFIGSHYRFFGHSKEQNREARRLGREIGQALISKKNLSTLTLRTDLSLP